MHSDQDCVLKDQENIQLYDENNVYFIFNFQSTSYKRPICHKLYTFLSDRFNYLVRNDY